MRRPHRDHVVGKADAAARARCAPELEGRELEAGRQPRWVWDDGGGGGGPGRRQLQLRLRFRLQYLAGFLFQHGPVIGPLPGCAETCILGEGSLGRPGRGLTGVGDRGAKAGRLGEGLQEEE